MSLAVVEKSGRQANHFAVHRDIAVGGPECDQHIAMAAEYAIVRQAQTGSLRRSPQTGVPQLPVLALFSHATAHRIGETDSVVHLAGIHQQRVPQLRPGQIAEHRLAGP
jgi:hypothetical protein